MSTTSPAYVEIDYIGVLREDPTVRLARSGSIIYALTACCGASGKGMEYDTGVGCRKCYAEVSPLYGSTFEEKDVIYTMAEATRLVMLEQWSEDLDLTEEELINHLDEVVELEDLDAEADTYFAWRVFIGEDEQADDYKTDMPA